MWPWSHQSFRVCDVQCISGNWSTVDDQGVRTFCWYIYLVVTARGSQKLTILRKLGTTTSKHRPRMPILTRAAWKTIADEIFSASSHVSLFSDGCKAYTLEHEGVADHQAVNHNAQEYVRSCQVLRNWETGERTLGKAGCQKAEGAWKHINDCIPESIAAPVTEAKEKILDLHIRHGQWRYMTGSMAYDFEAFGAVAARYNKAPDAVEAATGAVSAAEAAS